MLLSNNYFTECGIVPKRVILAITAFLGMVIAFEFRSIVSIAITEMVIPKLKRNEADEDDGRCPIDPAWSQGLERNHSVSDEIQL